MPQCSFCKAQIAAGTGFTVFRRDGTPVHYCSSKCLRYVSMGRKPAKFKWTRKKQG